jgi:hypothetical protein
LSRRVARALRCLGSESTIDVKAVLRFAELQRERAYKNPAGEKTSNKYL